MTKWLHGIVENALPEWEAEVWPEVQGAGENGVRTMAPEKQGTKQVGPPAANAGKFTVATLAENSRFFESLIIKKYPHEIKAFRGRVPEGFFEGS
jgi:hypothetical protein